MLKLSIKSIFMIQWLILFFIIYMTINQMIHPISLLIMMIIFNISMYSYMSMWKMNFMFSIMMFLIMISGLMIIFMYFSSLISNNEMKFNLNFKLLFMFIMNLINMMIYLINSNSLMLFKFNFIMMDSNSINFLYMNKFMNIIKMYEYPFSNLTLLSIMFILFMFISIIKINSSSFSMSMRKIKYD